MISLTTILIRLGVALLLGAIIGLERESRNQDAGFRTHALVSLGTALFTIISAYGFLGFLEMNHIQLDPARIASYVVAGIGFLGGGAIFFQRDSQNVKGLTTAAAIWTVAAIGMACGVGMIWEAVLVTLMTLFVLWVLRFLEAFLLPNTTIHTKRLRVIVEEDSGLMGKIYDICEQEGIMVEQVEIVRTSENRDKSTQELFTFIFHSGSRKAEEHVIDKIRTFHGVKSIKIYYR